jgi:hypothetical protein
LERVVAVAGPIDLRLTLGPLHRGRSDPSTRFDRGAFLRATRTPEGPATQVISMAPEGVLVEAWGPGAAWLLDAATALLGADDTRRPRPPSSAHRRARPSAWPASDSADERDHGALVPPSSSKVTGTLAHQGFSGSSGHRRASTGPVGLRLPPRQAPGHAPTTATTVRHRTSSRRAVRRVAREPSGWRRWLPAAVAAQAALRRFPGVGPWTAAEVAARALGDPDAVSVGDFHLRHLVCWALAGEARGTDERMLEILEPYRGQRGRVIRLLEASGIQAPAYGPRLAARRIERD